MTECHNMNDFSESWSSTQIKVVKLKHTWTINNFSSCCKTLGERLESPTFSAGINDDKTEWCLWLYPKGLNENVNDCVSLFISLIKSNMDNIRAAYKFSIVNTKGQHAYIRKGSARIKEGNFYGFQKFLVQTVLFTEENQLLLDDKLTIFCEINATVGSGNISDSLTTPQSNRAIDFTFLLDNKQFSDIILSAGGKEFSAHKVILTARSPVFRAMFQNDMEESMKNRVEISDLDEEGLGEMLRYMYTGEIKKLEKIAPSLLVVAEKYAMDDLKITCEKSLFKSLSLENAIEIFILSDAFRATELKMQVKKFIAANASVIVNTPEFESMVHTYPQLGLEAFCTINA